MNSELYAFIKESLEKGIGREKIQEALMRAGWEKKEVEKSFASFAEFDFPVPVPRKRPYLQAREAFLYLISFITLYISALSFGALMFAFLDIWFPDAVQRFYYRDPSFSALRMAIASLIIAYPLHLLMMRAIRKGVAKDPERRESKIRKWLTYLTLVVGAAILIGDLIAVVFHLLGGELAIRFLLKALTIFLITGTIFGYYLTDLRKEEEERE